MHTDGFINLLDELSAALDGVRRKPAAHPMALQIHMKTFCKLLILTRIADKAGIELEGLIEERGQVVNQRVWQATAAEKSQGEESGFGEGAMVEGAGTIVTAGL